MTSVTLKTTFVAGLCIAAASCLNAQTYLWLDHADVGVNYEDHAWDLHVHHHELGEFAPTEAVLGVDLASALFTVPTGAQWSFLGAAGDSVWILPQTHNENLLFLGLGTEELAAGLFTSDQVTLSLKAVNGPGVFVMYQTDMFGTSSVFMNSGDGITGADSIGLIAGAHRHVNWAFTEPGLYEIVFEASGTLAEGNVFTSSGNVTYAFEVTTVPEPSSVALVSLGLLSILWRNQTRRL
jgi:surface-anchored protein